MWHRDLQRCLIFFSWITLSISSKSDKEVLRRNELIPGIAKELRQLPLHSGFQRWGLPLAKEEGTKAIVWFKEEDIVFTEEDSNFFCKWIRIKWCEAFKRPKSVQNLKLKETVAVLASIKLLYTHIHPFNNTRPTCKLYTIFYSSWYVACFQFY
jgi:hypothetical protein